VVLIKGSTAKMSTFKRKLANSMIIKLELVEYGQYLSDYELKTDIAMYQLIVFTII